PAAGTGLPGPPARGRPERGRALPPGPRPGAALPAGRALGRLGRADHALALPPLPGGGTGDRRQRGRHPGNPGRAARCPGQAALLPRALAGAQPADRAGQRGGLMAFEELKQRQSAMWGAGPFERVEATIPELPDAVFERLSPYAEGATWLDVACGTGGLALRAARAGAQVTGIDLAPVLIETAAERATAEGISVDFRVGD